MMAMSGGKKPRYGDKIDTIELDPKTQLEQERQPCMLILAPKPQQQQMEGGCDIGGANIQSGDVQLLSFEDADVGLIMAESSEQHSTQAYSPQIKIMTSADHVLFQKPQGGRRLDPPENCTDLIS